jgi:hypothetical protein
LDENETSSGTFAWTDGVSSPGAPKIAGEQGSAALLGMATFDQKCSKKFIMMCGTSIFRIG